MELKFQVEKYRLKEQDSARYLSLHNEPAFEKSKIYSRDYAEMEEKAGNLLSIFASIKDSSPTIDTVTSLEKIIDEQKHENNSLREMIRKQEEEIEQLRIKIGGEYENELLSKRNPSLY